MKKTLLILFLFLSIITLGQQKSKLQISLITCSPGNELYSIFGHTAIRIVDSTNGNDYFFNYGTFDFNDPNFYSKFVRGKLDYFLNIDDGKDFFRTYAEEGRKITEQVLFATEEQKQNILNTLLINLEGSNRFYKYDFLFDNCTTRARDVLIKNGIIKNNFLLVKPNTTFRNMLYQYLDAGGMCWSKFGIDVLLGSKIDVAVTREQSSFLPDYLSYVLDSVNKEKKIIEKVNFYNEVKVEANSFINYVPLIIFSFITILVAFCFSSSKKIAINTLLSYSRLILFFTGLIGILLLFMWFGTNHKSCGNNYNLLWALPTNFIALFFTNKKFKWMKVYFNTITILTLCLCVAWFFLPQQFNIALLPFALGNLLCYKFLTKRFSN